MKDRDKIDDRSVALPDRTFRTAKAGPNGADECENGYRLLYENAPLGYQSLDGAGRFLRVNQEWTNLLGYSRDEVVGGFFHEYLVSRNRHAFREKFAELSQGRSIRGLELEMARKVGDPITVALDANTVIDENGDFREVLCIVRDITERKRVEKAIERAKKEWENTFDSVPDLIAVLDDDCNMVRLNKTMANRLGMDVRDAVGKKCHLIVHGLPGPPDNCPHEMLRKDGKEHAIELHEPRLGGTFLVTASPIYGEDGKLIGSVHVARDITERKIAEEELRRAHDELEHRVRQRTAELRAANDLLVRKIRTIDQLYEHIVESGKAKAIAQHTAEVAHELRQPLAIIGGFARRILKHFSVQGRTENKALKESSGIIVGEVERLEKILTGLIEFTRRETLGLRPVNPNVLVHEVLTVNEGMMQDKDLTYEVNLDPNVGEILLDPERFQQVLRNITANAIEASTRGQVIRIETALSKPSDKARETGELDSEEYFELKIQNQGSIIPPHRIEEIFSPFFTTKESGMGLGLTLSKRIIEDHRGSISVKSDKEGTVFTVWVPARRQIAGNADETLSD
ncbi:MAG: PAS domain S-box protein [Pseudomonadota bacterium]